MRTFLCQNQNRSLLTRVILVFLMFMITACGPMTVRLPDDPTSESLSHEPEASGTLPKPAERFSDISYSDNQAGEILKLYNHLDPGKVVPTQLLKNTVLYFHRNKANIPMQKYIVVIDYAQSSKNKRLYLVNMNSGSVWTAHVAHGKGSDANHDGYAEKFSNVSGSNTTSLGFFLTAETYNGSNGYSLRLDGLSSTNSKARSRAIVVHGADYVQDRSVIQGRSWGCPAITQEYSTWFINLIKGGALMYAGVSSQSASATPSPSPTPAPTATPAPTPKPTPTPSSSSSLSAPPLWEAKVSDGKLWTAYVMSRLDTLGSAMLKVTPSDYATFCPKYTNLTQTQRKEFWTYLLSAMVRYESNFNPKSSYQEAFADSTGNRVVSRGLLQISIESANGYGCGFKNAQELHDPYLNLNCGIRILNRWIGERDLRIAGKVSSQWRGGARYWSVLRTTSGSYNSIVSLTKNTPLCK